MSESVKENICRICLKLTDESFKLFDTYENEKTLCDIFNQFLDEKLLNDDSITSSICEKCAESIVEFHNLIVTFTNTEKFFKKLHSAPNSALQNTPLESDPLHDSAIIKDENDVENEGVEELIFQFDDQDIPQSEVIIEDNGEISYFDDTEDINKKSPKQYMCEVCGSFWKRLSDFKDHYETHLSVYNYECTECGKKLKTRSTYSRHMQRHKGHHACICEQCGQTFACKNTLKTHIYLKHIRERKWVCQICNKAFPLKSTLQKHVYRQHIREDDPERRHKCNLCNVEYLDKCSLNRHMEIKHGNKEKVFCDLCKRGYSTKGHLNRHMRVKHLANDGEIRDDKKYQMKREEEEDDETSCSDSDMSDLEISS